MTNPDQSEASFYYHKAQHNPDIQGISSMTLYEGPRVKKEISYTVIKDRKTGEFHHDCISFKTYRKTKNTPPHLDPKSSFTLSDDKNQELTKALVFMQAARQQHNLEDGKHKLQVEVPPQDIASQIKGLKAQEQIPLLLELMQAIQTEHHPQELLQTLQGLELPKLENMALIFHIALCRQVLGQFANMLKDPFTTQRAFEQLLQAHPWILGAEYSEPIDVQSLIPDLDSELFIQRLSTGELELLEIKTPLDPEQMLFLLEPAHGVYYPCAELSQSVGLVQKYLSQLAPLKVKAKLIIGYTYHDSAQNEALRLFNSHLQQIEVITFDQVLQQAKHTLAYKQHLSKQGWNEI
jgi:hypothetical protein